MSYANINGKRSRGECWDVEVCFSGGTRLDVDRQNGGGALLDKNFV